MRVIKNRNVNGRPKKSTLESINKRVSFKLRLIEYKALYYNAAAANITVSELIRSALRNCTIKERLSATHLKLITQLTGMANNLNQIAKRANQAGYIVAKNESETLAKSIDNVIKSIENDG